MIVKYIFSLFLSITVFSCTKVDVEFGNERTEDDPNIVYVDDYPVDIATYKIDSFRTSSNNIFTIGHHKDSAFGTITAGSYTEINLPAENPVENKSVSFDSIVLMIKPNGNYYGDTLNPLKINVHRLTEKIENEDISYLNYFNPGSFQYDPVPLGQTTLSVKPLKGGTLNIRLSDIFGQELLQKFKTNALEIREPSDFVNYFKGLYFGTDSAFTKSIYYFGLDSTNVVMRLHYKLNGTIIEEKHFDFQINSNKQFNSIRYHHSGTNLSSFTPFKTQLKKSNLTGHKAYLNSNMGSYIKISFPTILNIKELKPYLKIVKAELVIKPSPGTYRYPYKLPPSLLLYKTDENNGLNFLQTDYTTGQNLTGNLYIDRIFGEDTKYTYDISGFINDLIQEGQFSNSALMLTSPIGASDEQLDRLVINDQTLNNSIQLKLYLLAL